MRNKTTWIDAINAFRLEDSTDNDEQSSVPPTDKVNPDNSDNIIDVSHNAVHDSTNSIEVKGNDDYREPDTNADSDEWGESNYSGTSNSEQSKLNQVEDW